MQTITFITGNQGKADYLARYLDMPVTHKKIDLHEVQSLNLRDVTSHKVRQAYSLVRTPVIVEDVSLEFAALGRLPGTFIRFYVEEVPFETLCRTLDGLSRTAVARCMYAYYDGVMEHFFEGVLHGTIAEHPAGEGGYGWDQIFIPDGHTVTRAQMAEGDDKKTYLQLKPYAELKRFLEAR